MNHQGKVFLFVSSCLINSSSVQRYNLIHFFRSVNDTCRETSSHNWRQRNGDGLKSDSSHVDENIYIPTETCPAAAVTSNFETLDLMRGKFYAAIVLKSFNPWLFEVH